MQNSIAQQIYNAAPALLAAGARLREELTSILNHFLKWPFKVDTAYITDSAETTTEPFPIVIYTSSQVGSQSDPVQMKADAVACVFHLVNILTTEELRIAYERIGAVKRLKKTQTPQDGFVHTDTPLGIVFAVESSDPLEKLAEQMMLLNKAYPSVEWPDMVAVLTRGTINYVVQFEGDKIGGDFLLPSNADFPVMAMYVHVFARSLGLFSLNRMCAFVFMHLQVFSPGTQLPDMQTVLKGVSQLGITLGGYQFNLNRQLVPVPDEMYVDRGVGLRNLPFRIEDKKGKLLSRVQFIPWQDGGVVRVIGNMPLEMLLGFLGPIVENTKKIKQSDGEISSVLPIGQSQFREMLIRFQQQTNMVVKPEEFKGIVSKFFDEGTSSPFIARLFLGALRLRDIALPDPADRKVFDKSYDFVVTTILNTRITARQIVDMLTEHKRKVFAGEIARLQGLIIHIDENIDRELRKHTEDFLNSGVRVIKQGMQDVTKILHLNIGFLFKKENAFENGVRELANIHPELAAYLRETRKWSERLISSRNAVEHEGWTLPRIEYKDNSGQIQTEEPQISGQPITEFVQYMIDRLCCFTEEVTAYALLMQMPEGISITEIPLSQRNPQCAERFRIALVLGGMPLWSIAYHESPFEET